MIFPQERLERYAKYLMTLFLHVLRPASNRVPKSVNPHKNTSAIRAALKRHLADGCMDYESFYNEINYVSPGIHLQHYFPYCLSKCKKGDRWLDVGCGSGNILQAAQQYGIRLYGLDVVDKSVTNALSHGIQCQKCSAAATYPFPDEFFDFVTCTDVLEHLTKGDTETAIAEIFRVLKFGSCALLAPALCADRTGLLHLTIEDERWWKDLFQGVGFVVIDNHPPKGIIVMKQ